MAEASSDDAPSAVLATAVHVARAVWSVPWTRSLLRAARLAALPLSLVTVPLSYVAEALLVVLAPLLYLIAFLASSVQGIISLLVSLKVRVPPFPSPRLSLPRANSPQPLYSFVSSLPPPPHCIDDARPGKKNPRLMKNV